MERDDVNRDRSDAEYHDRREAEERERADAANDIGARAIHNALADRHADRAWSLREADDDAA